MAARRERALELPMTTGRRSNRQACPGGCSVRGARGPDAGHIAGYNFGAADPCQICPTPQGPPVERGGGLDATKAASCNDARPPLTMV